jgi:DNA-binding MarR family transcriptional regulator
MSASKDIFTILRMIKRLREVESEMPAQMVHCFLGVALQPGITMQQLGDETGLSQSATSRNIQTLGKWHRIGKAGYDLATAIEDPEDSRRKIMFLTPKGNRLIRDLLSDLTGAAVEYEGVDPQEYVTGRYKARQARYRAAS